ncbi:hypothetical protein ACH5RR_040292 [Cinchona calisaya]|uniref:Uncharacterized protein n=1 Tax=Cinchona calisaya TaxID=153742 RepID=A0ABD2XVK5_9GENT
MQYPQSAISSKSINAISPKCYQFKVYWCAAAVKAIREDYPIPYGEEKVLPSSLRGDPPRKEERKRCCHLCVWKRCSHLSVPMCVEKVLSSKCATLYEEPKFQLK